MVVVMSWSVHGSTTAVNWAVDVVLSTLVVVWPLTLKSLSDMHVVFQKAHVNRSLHLVMVWACE
jgi:hypothetical protein